MPEKELRTFESSTLGVPPLRMVLVHARDEARNALPQAGPAPVESKDTDTRDAGEVKAEQAVRRIIEHLESAES